MQAAPLNPEIGIVVDNRIILFVQGMKADVMRTVEGSSPECATASDQDTSGVW